MTANTKVQAFKKSLIIETAQQLFREKPYESVTVEEIAKAAGFGKSTLYSFFESKEEILDAIIKSGLGQLSTDLQRITEDESNVPIALKQLIPLQYQFFLEYNNHLFTYIQKCQANVIKQELRDELRQLVMQKSSHLLRLVQRGVKTGIFIDADPAYLTWFINSMIKGICMPSILLRAELRDQIKDLELLQQVILKGVMASKHRTEEK